MKALHVCNSLKSGGITTFVESITELNETSEVSHDLVLIFESEKNKNLDKCKTYFLNYNRKNHISCIKKVAHIYRTYDAIMIHAAHPVIVFPLLFRRKKCFIFQHGMSVSSGLKFKRMIKKIWYSLIPVLINARIICASEFAYNKTRMLGILLQKKRCHIIPFGVEISEKHRERKHTKSGDVIRLGMAGRLVSQKRFNLVLRSLLSYTGRTKFHLKIAGDGPDFGYLKKIADSINNKNVNINFLGNLEDMNAFYDEIDLFLLPSESESFGLVVLEALTRFIPVAVFSDVGGCLSVIEDGMNGFVIKDGIKGLESLWKLLDENNNVLLTLSESMSRMDLCKYDIIRTRRQLDHMVFY